MIVYADPKQCKGCLAVLPAPDCFAVARRSGGRVWLRGTCRRCINARTPWTEEKRRRQAERKAALSPEELERRRRQQREAKRRRLATSQEARVRELARQRRYRRRKSADPEWRQRENERVMEHKREKRRALLAQREELARQMEKLEAEMKLRLPVGPLLDYLDEKLEHTGEKAMAEVVDINARQFRRWRVGDPPTVSLEVADRILTRLGDAFLLGVLWPDIDERLEACG